MLSVNFGAAFSVGSALSEQGTAIAADSAGNIYVAGFFNSQSVDFDPNNPDQNPATNPAVLVNPAYNASMLRSNNEAFVAKYGAGGAFQWVTGIGAATPGDYASGFTPSGDAGPDIAVDASGEVYLTGAFSGTVAFGAVSLTAQGTDGFLAKLGSGGNVLWADQWAGPSNDEVSGVAVDSAGDAFITGSTGSNMFVSKYGPSGAVVWNEQVGGNSVTTGNAVALDHAGNVIVTGSFSGIDDFNPASGKSNVYNLSSGGTNSSPAGAGYVLKLNAASGGFVWADAFQGGAARGYTTGGSSANRLAVDASDNVFVTGAFSGSVDFNPGQGNLMLPNAGFQDAYVVKLNANGSLGWGQSMGSSNNDAGSGIATDSAGHVYVTGYFGAVAGDTARFGSTTLTDVGDYDVFVAQLDGAGNFLWAGGMGGPGIDVADGIVVDGSGNVYTTGHFEQTADFDPGPAVYPLTSAGGADMFVSKLTQSSGLVAAAAPSATTTGNVALVAAPASSASATDAALASYEYPLVEESTLAALARGKK